MVGGKLGGGTVLAKYHMILYLRHRGPVSDSALIPQALVLHLLVDYFASRPYFAGLEP